MADAGGRFGDVLAGLRGAAGRSLAEVAAEARVRESRLRQYEASQSFPGYRDLIRLAHYYGMGAHDLAARLAGRAD